MAAIDTEGKMKHLLHEIGPVPEKLSKKDDNYFILTINNDPMQNIERTARLLQVYVARSKMIIESPLKTNGASFFACHHY